VVKNVLISYVVLKKYIKKLDLVFRLKDIDFYVKIAMIIMLIILSVNSASKSIPIIKINKMILNGLVVINAKENTDIKIFKLTKTKIPNISV
jgi:amino acid transporter